MEGAEAFTLRLIKEQNLEERIHRINRLIQETSSIHPSTTKEHYIFIGNHSTGISFRS